MFNVFDTEIRKGRNRRTAVFVFCFFFALTDRHKIVPFSRRLGVQVLRACAIKISFYYVRL